jgi:hypothetical protein
MMPLNQGFPIWKGCPDQPWWAQILDRFAGDQESLRPPQSAFLQFVNFLKAKRWLRFEMVWRSQLSAFRELTSWTKMINKLNEVLFPLSWGQLSSLSSLCVRCDWRRLKWETFSLTCLIGPPFGLVIRLIAFHLHFWERQRTVRCVYNWAIWFLLWPPTDRQS